MDANQSEAFILNIKIVATEKASISVGATDYSIDNFIYYLYTIQVHSTQYRYVVL